MATNKEKQRSDSQIALDEINRAVSHMGLHIYSPTLANVIAYIIGGLEDGPEARAMWHVFELRGLLATDYDGKLPPNEYVKGDKA